MTPSDAIPSEPEHTSEPAPQAPSDAPPVPPFGSAAVPNQQPDLQVPFAAPPPQAEFPQPPYPGAPYPTPPYAQAPYGQQMPPPYPSYPPPPEVPPAPIYGAYPVYGGPNPYGNGMVPPPRRNGLALSGMILGIIGLVGSIFFLGAIVGVVGLILALIGLSAARRTGVGRGFAIAGIVTSILSLVIGTIVLVVALQNTPPKSCSAQGTSTSQPPC